MIIDSILDRKAGKPYEPKAFRDDVINYHNGDIIFNAFDSGIEDNVKHELCKYVIDNEYNHDICQYITSVKWL